MQQAVFYSNRYFLLPPEYTDFESFRQAVSSARKTSMTLKGLHYRLPLLHAFHVSAQLHGQYGCKKYIFTDTMREA